MAPLVLLETMLLLTMVRTLVLFALRLARLALLRGPLLALPASVDIPCLDLLAQTVAIQRA